MPASGVGWRPAPARGQGVEVLVLADQDFEDMFLADTQARLGRVMLREHDHVASLPTAI